MKKFKIIHWVITVIFAGMFLMSASMYLTKTGEVNGFFEVLGFPTWLVYPMAIAKIVGAIIVLTKVKKFLVEWAYAGFLINLLLAAGAHLSIGDGIGSTGLVFALWLGSYVTWKYAWSKDAIVVKNIV